MNKKKIDQIVMLGFLIAIVAGSVYLFSDDAIPPELLPSAGPTPVPTPLLAGYVEAPAGADYVQPADVPSEASTLVDGWTIFFAVAALAGVGMLVAVMVVSKKAATKHLPAAGAAQPSLVDLPLFDEPALTTRLVAATTARPTQQSAAFFPQAIYEVVNGVLLSRGGQGSEGPNYWIEKERCSVNPLAWTLGFDYRDGNDPVNVQKYMVDLQSRLCKAGYDTNVRLDAKRCVIEVVNPAPPVFRLRDHWQHIKALPQNERACVPGVETAGNIVRPKVLYMRGERAGTMIAGRTGSGKTQVVLSEILTGCLMNSPAKLALIIGDIKGDTKPLDRLPHLAIPVLTDVDDIANMLTAALAEMAARQRRAARGDRSFNGKAIWIVLDEVAGTLLAAGDRSGETIAAIQQLTMVGRSLGFLVTMATQRIYDVKPDVYSNCGRRFGLKLNTPTDSVSLTGAAGTRLNELRGKGAFEVFDAGNAEGERGQGFFVADPEEEGYAEELHWYVDEVVAHWAGVRAHYRLELPEPDGHDTETPRPVKRSWQAGDDDGWDNTPGGAVDDWTPDADVDGAIPLPAFVDKYGEDFFARLLDECAAKGGALTGTFVGELHEEMFAAGMNGQTRGGIRDDVIKFYRTHCAGIGKVVDNFGGQPDDTPL